MSKATRFVAILSGVAATTIMLAAAPAYSQSSGGTVAKSLNVSNGLAPTTGLNGPIGPGESRMPFARTQILNRTAERAGNSDISETPGSVPSFQEARSSREASDLARPEAYGRSTAPYTTARVAVSKLGPSQTAGRTPVTSFPYRATGKLWVRFGSDWYICTASLIKKGVLVTAAHCIFNYGQRGSGWADEVLWYPANFVGNRNVAPYGGWAGIRLRVPAPYFNGTDTCAQEGVVCNNDIATVILDRDNGGRFAGNLVGWYGYAWNGFSYRVSSFLGNARAVQITQLGYPGAFDRGYQMQRTDAVGWFVRDGQLRNTQIGSAQTGGSSGGPWLVNFGTRPRVVAGQASLGNASRSNLVVGVTSYGAVEVGFNRQGASFFGQNREFPARRYGSYGGGNIGALVQATCNSNPAFC